MFVDHPATRPTPGIEPERARKLLGILDRFEDPAVDRERAWDSVSDILRIEAERDLRHAGQPGLYVAAADGDAALLVARSRPFDEGDHLRPVIELVALAVALGADRVAVAIGGRAWSLDDPIPPTAGAVDLRQPVLAVHLADGHGDHVELATQVHTWQLEDGDVVWDEIADTGGAAGVIADLLHSVLDGLGHFDELIRAQPEAVLEQFARCDARGHDVHLTPTGLRRVLAPVAG